MDLPKGVIRLKKSREKPIKNYHPWIYSGSITSGEQFSPGDIVDVVSHDDRWLARAYYNPNSQIRARILSWDEHEMIDASFWRTKLRSAIERRASLKVEPNTTAYRLINAEADGLPGLVVDRYEGYLVIQSLTAGIDSRKKLLSQFLAEMVKPKAIYERSDVKVRRKEGLGQVQGIIWGQAVPETTTIKENDLSFAVNISSGHKTGFYLDQRENRAFIGQEDNAEEQSVLNVFSYTGGFGIYAAAAGANSIVNIDNSSNALEMARHNMALNGFEGRNDEYVVGNAFDILRTFRDDGRRFDMVILDPPKFAHSRRDVDAACRGYKDLNWLAMRILKPGGHLATFSCSGLVSGDLFQKVLFSASVDAERDARILRTFGQAADHPILLTFPESAYLKGFYIQVA